MVHRRLVDGKLGVAAVTVGRTARPKAGGSSAAVSSLIGLMAVVGGVLHLSLVRTLTPLAAPVSVDWWVLAAGFFAAGVLVAHVTVRSESHTVTLVEVPLVIGLALSSPTALLAGRLAGSTLAQVLHRRLPARKVAFNLSLAYVETVIAIVVYRAILGAGVPPRSIGLIGVLGAVVAMQTVGLGAMRTVLDLTDGSRPPGWATLVSTASAVAAGLVGYIGAALLWEDRRLAVVIVALGALLWLGLAGTVRTRLRTAALEQVGTLGGAIAGLDRVGVAGQALTRARSSLNAEGAELVIIDGNGGGERFQLDADGRLIRIALDEATVRLLPRSTTDPVATHRYLSHRGYRDGMVAVIPGADGGPKGMVAAFNRLGPHPRFRPGDADLLESIAAQTGLALR